MKTHRYFNIKCDIVLFLYIGIAWKNNVNYHEPICKHVFE